MSKAIREFRERLLDGADLLIDFATLGEYGLEPVDAANCRPERCAPARRHRPARFRDAVERYERVAG
ncbi:MAG TPA: hypothetical protein VHH72_07040 [Solirubrobacterales bacterium]|jgi:hypothetical protein|nr:hypothetical protein [Solirubrobacterales bacterium]